MMIFIWANKYFIWINQFKTKYSIETTSFSESIRHWESEGKSLQSAVVLKVIDLDQYILYDGWHTQVNDRFQDYKTFEL